MLVLECLERQSIWIGDGIQVYLVRARGGKAKLAFTAPDEIRIDREVVRKRRKAEGSKHVP